MANHTLAQNLARLNKAREDIADAIVARGGSATHTDGLESMPASIQAIPNQYAQADEGKVVQSGALVSQTATSTTTNGTIDTTTNNSIVVNVANSYSAADEGKVVSNGALIAQTAYPLEITANNTYDTTNYSSITVNVSSTTNSGVAYPPVATGFINVSFIGNKVYVSTALSDTSSADTTATFKAPFKLSNFISSDMTFTIEGYRNSSASLYTMTVKLVPSNNQIVYKTAQSLTARSIFAGYSSIPT